MTAHSNASMKIFTSKQTAVESDVKENLSSNDVQIAHPNDLTCSIRPINSDKLVR